MRYGDRGFMVVDLSKTYYLSGPMAGYDELNFPIFYAAAEDLRDAGFLIVSPAELELPEGIEEPAEADYLANDFAAMCRKCSGIILMNGWPQSTGARAELEIALTLKWPVYFYDTESKMITNMNKRGIR